MSAAKPSSLSQRVIKAMSVFGGVQIVNILCSVIRTKLVAIWIGATGVGLFGIYNSAVELISQITMLGIGSTGSRDMAQCDSTEQRRRTLTVVRRWVIALGALGAVATFLLSPLLSRWSFGDADHTWAFRWLSLAVFMTAITAGETSILQGLSRFKRVARAMLGGSIAGTAIAVPLFYWLRVDSIVPVILVSMLCLMVSALSNREREIKPVKSLTLAQTVRGGRSLITLGFYITLSGAVSYAASYVLMAYFTNSHGSETAGLYQSGFTLINRYIGLVFTAISMEYYPRLSGVVKRRMVSEVFVSHEMKIALCVLVPLIGAFIVASPLIVSILYSEKFVVITPFIEIGITGTVFRTISWCMAFMILVRGDGRMFIASEAISAAVYVVINILTYNTLGIEGMGVAYIVWYLLYSIIIFAVFRLRYHMHLRRGLPALIIYSLLMSGAILLLSMTLGRVAGGVLTAIAAAVSLGIFLRKPRSK